MSPTRPTFLTDSRSRSLTFGISGPLRKPRAGSPCYVCTLKRDVVFLELLLVAEGLFGLGLLGSGALGGGALGRALGHGAALGRGGLVFAGLGIVAPAGA